MLKLNIIGDAIKDFRRHDYRALMGLPIDGAMIVYTARAKVRSESHCIDAKGG